MLIPRPGRRVVAAKRMGAGMVERHGERRAHELTEPAFTIRASAGGMEPGGFVWAEAEGEIDDPRT